MQRNINTVFKGNTKVYPFIDNFITGTSVAGGYVRDLGGCCWILSQTSVDLVWTLVDLSRWWTERAPLCNDPP